MKTILLLCTLMSVTANAFYIDLTGLEKGQVLTGKMAKYLHKFLPPDSTHFVGGDAIYKQLYGKHFKGMKIKIGNEVLYLKCSNAMTYSYMDRAGNMHYSISKDQTKCQLLEHTGGLYEKKYSLVQLASLANTYNSFNVKLPYHYSTKPKLKPLPKIPSKNPNDWDKKFPGCELTAQGCNP